MSTGEMPLTPSPRNLVPLKVQKRNSHRSAANRGTKRNSQKTPLPEAVAKSARKHRTLLKNQQKELKDAIDNAPLGEKKKAKGRILNKQGGEYQDLSHATLSQLPGARIKANVTVGKGEGAKIDLEICIGTKTSYVESKLSIRTVNQRTIDQLKNGVRKSKGGPVFLNVARKPTARELKNLESKLGSRTFKKIKIVSSQSELYSKVKAALEQEPQ